MITPGPDGVVNLPPATPGQIYAFASPTPFPTRTPRPTPTRRPGPTATAMPLPKPAANAAGVIYYTIQSSIDQTANHSFFSLPVNGQGETKTHPEPVIIPANLDFTPYQIMISPNQNYVVYMQSVEPGGRPHVYNSATGETKVLFEEYSGGQFFGWHPDGRHFLFWIDDVGLWLIDAQTFETTTLAYPEGLVQGAAISPDGLSVAYIAENRPIIGSLWFVDAAGNDAKPQFDAGNASYLYSTAWAPTSDRLLYYGNCPPSTPEVPSSNEGALCIFNIASQDFQSLKLPFTGYAPVWSPDGRYIAATGIAPNEAPCTKVENLDNPLKCLYKGRMVYVVDTATGKVSPLTPGIAPTWSPDGSRIAFLSDRTGSSELWTIGHTGEAEKKMTGAVGFIAPRSLSWLPEVQ